MADIKMKRIIFLRIDISEDQFRLNWFNYYLHCKNKDMTKLKLQKSKYNRSQLKFNSKSFLIE